MPGASRESAAPHWARSLREGWSVTEPRGGMVREPSRRALGVACGHTSCSPLEGKGPDAKMWHPWDNWHLWEQSWPTWAQPDFKDAPALNFCNFVAQQTVLNSQWLVPYPCYILHPIQIIKREK